MSSFIASLFGVSVLGILVDIVIGDNSKYLSFVFDIIVVFIVLSGILRLIQSI